MREEFDLNRIKDKSNREQRKYFGGYVKETIQQANFRKRVTAESDKFQRAKCVENASKRMAQEGIINKVPHFFKDVIGARNLKVR